MNIVFLDRATFSPEIRFDLPASGAWCWREHRTTSPEELVARSADADVVITNKVRFPATVLTALPGLRLVAVAATGVDHVDVDAARARGVAVCNVGDYATDSVPEHVFAMLLALRRNLLRYRQAVADGAWARSDVFCLHDYPIDDLAGSTLGVVGVGSLGAAVARLGEAFGMRVLRAEHRGVAVARAGRTAFAEVLRASDVLSLHVPLSDATRGLIGAAELAAMKRGAILVNAARGGVVDEDALLAALGRGHLGGACVDVLGREPPAADHPLLCAKLPNLMVTPHVAWASRQAQQRLADEVMANIVAFAHGETRNRLA